MSRHERPLLLPRLLRLALLAYPRHRRSRDGDEIVVTALDAVASRPSRVARAIFAGRVLFDVVRSGLLERVHIAGSSWFEGSWRDGWLDLKVATRSLLRALTPTPVPIAVPSTVPTNRLASVSAIP